MLSAVQDTPDGSYAMLEKKGKKQKANLFKELFNGLCNYRIWLLAACYAYSFGVEVGPPPPPLSHFPTPLTQVMGQVMTMTGP